MRGKRRGCREEEMRVGGRKKDQFGLLFVRDNMFA
jgi:hypothetical protein